MQILSLLFLGLKRQDTVNLGMQVFIWQDKKIKKNFVPSYNLIYEVAVASCSQTSAHFLQASEHSLQEAW